jgi:hypothetical protein
MKVLMFIVLFLLIGAFFIISNENLRINSQENFDKFTEFYGSWIEKLVRNSGTVAGYLVKMEWLPEEEG